MAIKKAAKKKAPPKGRTTNKEMFGASAVARAKKVVKLARVVEKETGEEGTVTGLKGGYLRVKWDNRDKSALVRPSVVRVTNPKKGVGSRVSGVGVKKKAKRTTIVKARVIKKLVVNKAGAKKKTISRKGAKAQSTAKRNPEPAWLQKISTAELRRMATQKGDCVQWIAPALKRRLAGTKKNPAPGTRHPAPSSRVTSGGQIRREFLGRGPTKRVRITASHLMPQSPTPDVLGRVHELKVKGRGIMTMPANAKLVATQKKKLWLANVKIAKKNPEQSRDTLEPVGEIEYIDYWAHKSPKTDDWGETHFGENKLVLYRHKLGEDSGVRPRLYVDHEGFPVIRGGNYSIDWRGIID